MQFSFMVGVTGNHTGSIFSFDQFSGRLEIKVDGLPVVEELRLLSVSTAERYDFVAGVRPASCGRYRRKSGNSWLARLQPNKSTAFASMDISCADV